MNRPFVNLKTTNNINELKEFLEAQLPLFKSIKGLIGIILNGGLSRGYGDHLSEIDVLLFLDPESYLYYQEKMLPFALGITKIEGQLFDIQLIDVEKESEKVYDPVGLWDLSYAEIIYDPTNKLTEMRDSKLTGIKTLDDTEGYLFEAWWNYKLAGDIWIHRGDIFQGHYMLNNAIQPLISAIYAVNNELIPHEKWLVHLSKTLNWQPKEWQSRLSDLFFSEDRTLEGLKKRQQLIASVWHEIDQEFKNKIELTAPIGGYQRYFYDLFSKLVEQKRIPIAEWTKISKLSLLNNDPFHKVVSLENQTIVLDTDKFLSLTETDMYQFHYEIAKVVRDKTSF